jgi:hypothetical protein
MKNFQLNRQQLLRERKRLLKKITKELESLYVNNPGMNTDIDSYNYGIHDAMNRIKKIL